jgi:ketosteroid isomerase-like protein
VGDQRRVVGAFLTAARNGDIEGLIAVLHDDVVLRVDEAAAVPHPPRAVRGADAIATGSSIFARFARHPEPALIDNAVGLVVAPAGHLRHVLSFTIIDGKITEIDIFAEPQRLRDITIALL